MIGLLRLRAALEVVKQLGVELKEIDFFEIPKEDFRKLQSDLTTAPAPSGSGFTVEPRTAGNTVKMESPADPDQRWYMLIYKPLEPGSDVMMANETDKNNLLKAVEYVNQVTDGMFFDSFGERVFYALGTLPPMDRGRKRNGGGELIEMPRTPSG